jgi:hypothetical protein
MTKLAVFLLTLIGLIHLAHAGRLEDQLDSINSQLEDIELERLFPRNGYQLPPPPQSSSPKKGILHFIGKDSRGVSYDIATNTIKVQKNGNISFNDMTDWDRPRYIENVAYFGTMGTVEINCAQNKIRRVMDGLFTQDNKLIKKITYNPAMVDVMPGTIYEQYKRYICP